MLLLATLESMINSEQSHLGPEGLLKGNEKYHSEETAQLLSPPQEYIPNHTKTECHEMPYSIETLTMTPPDTESADVIEADLYGNPPKLQVRIRLTASKGINFILTEYTLSCRCFTKAGTSPGHKDSTNQPLTSACNLPCGHLPQPHLPIYSICGNLSTPERVPGSRL